MRRLLGIVLFAFSLSVFANISYEFRDTSGITTNHSSAGTESEQQKASVPSAPTIDQVNPGNGQLTVVFNTPSDDGGSAITGYQVTCGGSGIYTDGSPVLFENLINGMSYDCSVTAINDQGNSPASNLVTGIPATLPDSPELNSVSSGDSIATLVFSAPLNKGGFPVTSYTANCDQETASGAGSPITISNLINGNNYNCSVYATTIQGNSEPSASMVASPVGLPDAPQGVVGTPGDGEISIAFNAPESDGGTPVVSYTADCGGTVFTDSASPILISGLTNDAEYSCSVIATNAIGNSIASENVAVTPFAPFPENAYRDYITSLSGLRNYWQLNETGSTAVDIVSGDNAYISANVRSGWPSLLMEDSGTSMSTNLSGNGIRVEHNVQTDALSQKSIIAFVRFSNFNTNQIIFKEGGSTNGWALGYNKNTDTIRLITRSSGLKASVDLPRSAISANTVYNFVGIIDKANNNFKLYVNGVKEIDSNKSISSHDGGGYMGIGSSYSSTCDCNTSPMNGANDDQRLYGTIDEVSVFNRVLTDQEIQNQYKLSQGILIN